MPDPRDNRLFFVDRDKHNLLITVGDSWTWGDSLGDSSIRYRSEHVYGKYLSEQLDTDWINYGYCGAGNNTVLFALERLLKIFYKDYCYYLPEQKCKQVFGIKNYQQYIDFGSSKDTVDLVDSTLNNDIVVTNTLNLDSTLEQTLSDKNYKNIYVCFTLTETGRDFDDSTLDKHNTLENMLQYEEKLLYSKLKRIQQFNKNLKLVVARNFSKDFDTTDNSISLDKNWIQVNFDKNNIDGFDNYNYLFDEINKSGAVSGVAFGNFDRHSTITDKKQYLTDQVDNVDNLWHWLANNPLHYNKATCHPTEESHKLWADYLIAYLK